MHIPDRRRERHRVVVCLVRVQDPEWLVRDYLVLYQLADSYRLDVRPTVRTV